MPIPQEFHTRECRQDASRVQKADTLYVERWYRTYCDTCWGAGFLDGKPCADCVAMGKCPQCGKLDHLDPEVRDVENNYGAGCRDCGWEVGMQRPEHQACRCRYIAREYAKEQKRLRAEGGQDG